MSDIKRQARASEILQRQLLCLLIIKQARKQISTTEVHKRLTARGGSWSIRTVQRDLYDLEAGQFIKRLNSVEHANGQGYDWVMYPDNLIEQLKMLPVDDAVVRELEQQIADLRAALQAVSQERDEWHACAQQVAREVPHD